MAFTSGVQSRNKDKLFLVGYPIHQITGCKLPSNRQVLCALFYNLRTVKLTVRESAKLTIREVFIFWGKARIPTKHEQDAITKLEKLHAEWRSLQKDRKKTSETAKNKFKQFVEKLNDLFDIAQQDALALLKLEEDKAFLVKQRQKGRPGSMAGVDLKLSRAEEIKAQKELAKMNRQIQEETFDIETDDEDKLEEGKEEEDTEEDSIYQELESLEEMDNPEEAAEDPGPSESKRMKVSFARGVKEILNMKLSIVLDRCKVSNRNATRILIATLEALNLDPLKYKVSKTLLHSRRQMFREQYTKNFLDKVNIPEKEPVVVHWDGKLLPGVLKHEQCERIAIAISYGEKELLLGVPVTASSSGEEQAIAVYEYLQEWGLPNTVKAMCFDTAASNTGRLKGACVLLEQMLGRELLHLACRHHILEIVLRGVFDTKMGSTTGPHRDIFKRFVTAWPKIDKGKYDTGISDNLIQKQLTPEVIANVTAEFETKLTESHPRDDYKELLQLVLVFVGSLDGNVVGFRTPGAIHHASTLLPCPFSFPTNEDHACEGEQDHIGCTVFHRKKEGNMVAMFIEDRMFLDIMDTQIVIHKSNSWVVPLSFRPQRRRLPNNRELVYRQFFSLRHKLQKSPETKGHFFTFMGKIFQNNHAEIAPELRHAEEC
ncbi:uncharacterized protein [Dendrobates tinctorius]|uniref:uncharacterized protein n=1 Tax=Dendrobates tinctorius TaxID=92724 RepID=UPI003CC9F8CB